MRLNMRLSHILKCTLKTNKPCIISTRPTYCTVILDSSVSFIVWRHIMHVFAFHLTVWALSQHCVLAASRYVRNATMKTTQAPKVNDGSRQGDLFIGLSWNERDSAASHSSPHFLSRGLIRAEDAHEVCKNADCSSKLIKQEFCLSSFSVWGLLLEVCDSQMLTLNIATVIGD